ncbi:MAG: hypothetical protein ACRDZO_26345 [Egibacteraceae bacterium]
MAPTERDGLRRQATDHIEQSKGIPRRPELGLAAAATRCCLLLTVPALAGGWFAAGRPGLVGAAIATALVTAQLYCSAAVLAICARRGGMTLMIGGYASFVGRLALAAAALALLAPIEGIHLPTLVISSIALMLGVLAYESWHVWRSPHFFWLEPIPANPTLVPAHESNTPERTHA